MKILTKSLPTLNLVVASICFVSAASGTEVVPPPNAPATAKWDAAKGQLTLEYHGTTIFTATVAAKNADGKGIAVDLDVKSDRIESNKRSTSHQTNRTKTPRSY